jgi:16S rRNA (guanine(1405)-N(7))-methyltransferase
MTEPEQIDELVSAVQNGAHYRSINPQLIRRIGAQELAKERSWKEAVKATRNKLHQVGGAYQEQEPDYPAWRAELDKIDPTKEPDQIKIFCRRVMQFHLSTRERLPVLERFYAETLASLGPVQSILDIACGYNPLALPWLPLAQDGIYYGCDIYADMVEFLNCFLTKMKRKGSVDLRDLIGSCPTQPVQLALLLKTIPCLEQMEKSAGLALLDGIQAEHLLVSFPARSLGGRSKGMVQNYEAHFRELIAGHSWRVQRFEFTSELVFLVSK